MSERWQLKVYDSGHLYVAELAGSAEIGRQKSKDEPQPSHTQTQEGWRVVIAPVEDIDVSRQHLGVEPLADGRVILLNKSNKLRVVLGDEQNLDPGESRKVSLPIVVRLGRKVLRLESLNEEKPPPSDGKVKDDSVHSLPVASVAPGSTSLLPEMRATLARAEGRAMEADQLVSWIEAFLGLLQSAAGSEDFYFKAARALVDLVRLDTGRVLLNFGGQWQVKATASRKSTPGVAPSSRILTKVFKEKRTSWQVPDMTQSTFGIDAVVAAPILDRRGDVIGALYGERQLLHSEFMEPVTRLEAMLVEVLASGVAAGLARVEQEQAALRARLQLEQAFGKRLASKLEKHPELLQGRATEVTVLFCDVRGFSRISERLGPARTVEWIGDVMGDLTQCVQDHDGVVIDYVGDELMAIWGAPEDQPDHAARACRAALAMFASLPKLNERWHSIVQEPLHLGVGINSGNAQVGDVGTKLKLKYGAMGNTVNLASRVQGATKHLKGSLLITDATKALLGGNFQTRRLCQVRVVNIEQPVTLYELLEPNQPNWIDLKVAYEQALDEFTKGEFRQACRILGRVIRDHPDDGPALILLSRAVGCLVEEPSNFDPVLTLSGK